MKRWMLAAIAFLAAAPAWAANGLNEGDTACLLPLNVCNFQLPKVRNFRLPLTFMTVPGL